MIECPSDWCHRPHQVTRWCWWSNAGDKRLKIKLWASFTHVFKKKWNYYEVKLHFKSASFSTDNCHTSRLPNFYCYISNQKTFTPKYLDNASRTSTRLLEEKPPENDFEKEIPVPRNTAAIKIWRNFDAMTTELRCHCNPDQNEFSPLCNTDVVMIFPTLCLWRPSLCLNLGGIHQGKPYRATLMILLEENFPGPLPIGLAS